MKFRIGTITVLMVVVLIAVKTYYRTHVVRIWEHVPAAVRAAAADQAGPIETPPLPDIGPGREIEPGVMFHEVRLPGGDKPGFAGKLWLYLPSGDHADQSAALQVLDHGRWEQPSERSIHLQRIRPRRNSSRTSAPGSPS